MNLFFYFAFTFSVCWRGCSPSKCWRSSQTIQFSGLDRLLLRLFNFYSLTFGWRFRYLFWCFWLFSFKDPNPSLFIPITVRLFFWQDNLIRFFFFTHKSAYHWIYESFLFDFLLFHFLLFHFLSYPRLSFWYLFLSWRSHNRRRLTLLVYIFYFERYTRQVPQHYFVVGVSFNLSYFLWVKTRNSIEYVVELGVEIKRNNVLTGLLI